jgi:hypothetical protein
MSNVARRISNDELGYNPVVFLKRNLIRISTLGYRTTSKFDIL